MNIEGNLHGYIIKAREIIRDAKLRLEKEREDEIRCEETTDYCIYTNLRNALLLLNEIEKLDDEEIALLKDMLKQEHGEEDDLGRLLVA